METDNSDLEDTKTDYIAQRGGNTLSALVTGSELVDALPSRIPIEDEAARVLQVSSRANSNATVTTHNMGANWSIPA